MFKRILAILSLIALTTCCNTITTFAKDAVTQPDIKAAAETQNVTIGTIFVGDSRLAGINIYCKLSQEDNTFVVCKNGQGYNWLKNSVPTEIKYIKNANPQIQNWNIVYELGINDLGNVDKYVTLYETLADTDDDIYLISVNPVEKHKYITNEQIEDFNEKLKSVNNAFYIDTYSTLLSDGFTTSDGVHFDAETSKKIDYLVKDIIMTAEAAWFTWI